jgi:hypothetical protein
MKRGFAAQFGERLKFLFPSPENGISASLQQAFGVFRNFPTAHRAVGPHFRFKKDLILYLNSSRAASSGMNSNLNMAFFSSCHQFKMYTSKYRQIKLVCQRRSWENYQLTINSGVGEFFHKILSYSGMNDFLLNRMLSERLRDR